MANYPLPKFHFQVEWGGANIGFTEVSGLDVQIDPIEYRDGASPEYVKTKMPGMIKYSNITMKRGTFKGDNEFYNWWNTVALNTIERRNVTISLLNENHEPVVVWKVKNAWPIKVQSSDLKSDGNEVAIESIELAHEGLVIQNE
ncbi:phage tail protein [Chitinophaga deserti]|uniref:phage tail protein n=1 Tax=Chitinophaga deserti TaxID=2164099 RepID=UPI000D6D488B|nr:phage tail protein [Chitinophaga deserti]